MYLRSYFVRHQRAMGSINVSMFELLANSEATLADIAVLSVLTVAFLFGGSYLFSRIQL